MSPMLKINSDSNKILSDTIIDALTRLDETRSVEYKESQPWDMLSKHIIKNCMAMANLRDGGLILIGIGQRDEIAIEGIQPEHLDTYDADVVRSKVNKYASPPVELVIGTFDYGKKTILAICVSAFSSTPILCKKPLDGQSHNPLCYIRGRNNHEATLIKDYDELRELIEIAAEKTATNILQQARRIGLTYHTATDTDLFNEELGDLA